MPELMPNKSAITTLTFVGRMLQDKIRDTELDNIITTSGATRGSTSYVIKEFDILGLQFMQGISSFLDKHTSNIRT